MSGINRRNFIKKSALAATAVGIGAQVKAHPVMEKKSLFKISLAQWSLNRSLFGGKLDNLDFAIQAKKHGIDAVEYVNQFFMDKAEDMAYLKEMKTRADGEGVTSVLIMCDREGALGDPHKEKRMQTVENHKKWVTAAKYLGCHCIRVNGFSGGTWGSKPDDFEESMKLVADGLHHLCVFANQYDIDVIIENHGGNSSNGKWLAGVMKEAGHHRAGTLPDFGNFRIFGDEAETISYDSYQGVSELMPYAKGVSVKPKVWDRNGKQFDLEYDKMMKIVLDAGYRGYCGIEHGEEGREWESILEVKKKLEASHDRLKKKYKS